MIKIILLSHGPLCEGMLKTLQMIAGPQKDIYTLQLHSGESPEEYQKKLEKILTQDKKGNLIFCDLKGGTPYNTAAYLKNKYDLKLITGMNLPILISVITSRENNSKIDDLVDIALDKSNFGIELINLNNEGEKKHAKLSLNQNR
ncbi:PTS sugar transporter subunit IIA [Ligilactobacillus acidipiscis]|uniref:PTS sugar transporter subunit IIA n=1 Tax=Ligilactobacillus acidipiscis TaxID=89059 RepID=UPI0023F81B98|nr:PTS mannose transporter subunit IIB [Ligilactobacillus acidipiscis]WEV56263.1 PTS mannose transporter subunit IIB [Ligilactobacillus acidipiscis]